MECKPTGVKDEITSCIGTAKQIFYILYTCKTFIRLVNATVYWMLHLLTAITVKEQKQHNTSIKLRNWQYVWKEKSAWGDTLLMSKSLQIQLSFEQTKGKQNLRINTTKNLKINTAKSTIPWRNAKSFKSEPVVVRNIIF